jgi:enoyl-CoA hydratase
MTFETFSYSCEDGVGIITLDRVERLNALSVAMVSELATLTAQLRHDDDLRVVIVTGAGRAFCAGADIEALAAITHADGHYRFLEAMQLAFNDFEALPVPTIAALNGIAYGGGCELALACDFRIMSERAKLGVPEIKLGLLPGAGGTQRLSRLLPAALAKQMIYLGEPLAADLALQHGLVNVVVPEAQVMATALSFATRLRDLAPLALRAAKLLVHGAALDGLQHGIEAERQAVAFLFQTQDAAEGIRAFLEKRIAQFKGL